LLVYTGPSGVLAEDVVCFALQGGELAIHPAEGSVGTRSDHEMRRLGRSRMAAEESYEPVGDWGVGGDLDLRAC
jgi:hypothetical protein